MGMLSEVFFSFHNDDDPGVCSSRALHMLGNSFVSVLCSPISCPTCCSRSSPANGTGGVGPGGKGEVWLRIYYALEICI